MLLLHHVLLVQVVLLLLLLHHELVLVRGAVVAGVRRAHQVTVGHRPAARRVRRRHLPRLGPAAAPVHLRDQQQLAALSVPTDLVTPESGCLNGL